MARKIKILILTHTFPTKYNPIASVFLLNQLNELKKYCDIRVIFPHGYVPNIKRFNPYYRFSKIPFEDNRNGIAVYHPKYFMIPRVIFGLKFLNIYLSIESIFSYLCSRKLADKIVESWNPDIIHMHGSLSEGWLGKRLKRRYKKPLLVTVYGEDITRLSKEMLSSSITKSNLKESDAIICQSEFLRSEIENIGIRNKKFFIIPMGAKTDRFKPRDKYKARKILNLPEDKKIALFVGHLVPRKGVEYLIRAIKIISEKDKNIFCYVIGTGHMKGRLQSLASELDLGEFMAFEGQKNHEEVPYYMNACDILVLPSLNEGLPVVLCEALACGKPVVATRVAGTPELVNDDVGFLVNPKDEKDLAEKIELALKKKWNIKKIFERAAEFSTSASAKKLMKVYNGVLKNKI